MRACEGNRVCACACVCVRAFVCVDSCVNADVGVGVGVGKAVRCLSPRDGVGDGFNVRAMHVLLISICYNNTCKR